ncbi:MULTISPECIES: LacI family DNA-binding transcriptional regulator [Corallincola]|uniref:LacI family DNA-binding transcriptional regulator n=3 Tax=Corallincola TaxID=1775176 RepID=A0A368NFE3_9GAMM|nr:MULTISPECIES: LacI family DNA-binding transcriptional regulator [Corallincola]RCU49198.1 LacI family DNA-binding transcriptional regulator [Corallincola holothuriorum]TAA47501.1 LacI family DNA-binding transcriptional regulator [Corallincola spongiicola]TCI05183.1 LacI family DNA-binding transcriptional regulator [Corallincola luteus]
MSSQRRRKGSGRVTLADIAAKVGVSKITVSRAIRTPDKVSESLRLKIQRCIDEQGYIPNRAAGALASSHSQTIALLVPSFSNTVFTEVVKGVDEVMLSEGYQVLIGHSGYSTLEEERLIETFLQYAVDGVILSGSQHTERARRMLTQANIPVVEMMELADNPLGVSVGFDQVQAGKAVTEYLIGKGHKTIGFAGARMDHRAQQRLRGWREAMWQAGLSDDLLITSQAPSSYAMGANLLAEFVQRWPDLDALFLCNDDLAAGALFECQRRNIRVPHDLAVIGFNDLPIAASTAPSLTTVATPRYEVGVRSAKELLRMLNEEEVSESRIDLGFEVKARESA